MNYLVSNDTKFICLKNNEESDSSCKEFKLCNTIIGEELSDSECNKYPVSKANQNTHMCIKDPNNNKCTEKFLCE